MSTQAYEFKPEAQRLIEQADGSWVAEFSATIYQDQHYRYTFEGVNAHNQLVVRIDVNGDETGAVAYRDGQTPAHASGGEEGWLLELYHGGDKKRSVYIKHSSI